MGYQKYLNVVRDMTKIIQEIKIKYRESVQSYSENLT